MNPALTCHSEYGKIETVFVKPAQDVFNDGHKVNNEWKALRYLHEPDAEIAKAESDYFIELIERQGGRVIPFSNDPSLTLDSVYCRDASIATNHGIIICHMGKPQRQGEPAAQLRDYLTHGLKILGTIQPPGTVEGGDVAWLDEKTLAAGLTYRTNEEGIHQLKAMLEPHGIEVVTVPLPHYKGPNDVFHLMSILSPVDKNIAVVYSALMPVVFRTSLLDRGIEFIEVPDNEFDSLGCNVLALAPRKCLLVKGNPKVKSRLEEAGCEVLEYNGDEISVNGGGGPTCLTRPVWRERS